jgi:hypothetical protein
MRQDDGQRTPFAKALDELRAIATAKPAEDARRRLHESRALLRRLEVAIANTKRITGI